MYEVGEIVDGKVKSNGIKNFGAFVELPDGEVGLVHISQVSNDYVENINNYLCEGQEVKVKLLGYNEVDGKKKISLSIKQANPGTGYDKASGNVGFKGNVANRPVNREGNDGVNGSYGDNRASNSSYGGNRGGNGGNYGNNNRYQYNKKNEREEGTDLDKKIAMFKKESDERFSCINNRLDSF